MDRYVPHLFVGLFILVLCVFLGMGVEQYHRHKERMTRIEKGCTVDPPAKPVRLV